MSDHFDALETRDPAIREQAQFAALPTQVAHARRMRPPTPNCSPAFDAAEVARARRWRRCR